ncbi:hypothetical protein E5J99_03415 [Hymenobacter elongatus]|uniref:Uncharacterized protein n=2 Tax=Hymenobacter elongatus TaxID=877208 RepID=A0A4Z0PPL2_9BACT|nr:hypothetical protein E5J99_03415 [Hymenobacter elongatus]
MYDNIKNGEQNIQSLKSTKEYNDLKNILSGSMLWKQGKYNCVMKVGVLNLKKPFIKEFNFELSVLEVKLLQKNIKVCEGILDKHYFSNDEATPVTWNWVNPKLI